MFNHVYGKLRKSTLFEKLLLVVGVVVGIMGFWSINRVFYGDPILSWPFLIASFLWMLLIFVIILTDSNESIKEELGLIIKEHIKVTELLKEEVVLLNSNLTKKKK